MIINPTTSIENQKGRQFILDSLKDRKKDNPDMVIADVGGSMFPWAREIVTHYLDFLNPKEYHKDPNILDEYLRGSETIKGDICDPKYWENMDLEIDFAICTQTLEDIRDPVIVLENLPKRAKSGFITVPNKWSELCETIEIQNDDLRKEWGLHKKYLGYCHHRWIFTIPNVQYPTLTLFPKLNFIDALFPKRWWVRHAPAVRYELSFLWTVDIPYRIINNDFLGPNPPSVFDYYKEWLPKGL